jgi:hypothetical protein
MNCRGRQLFLIAINEPIPAACASSLQTGWEFHTRANADVKRGPFNEPKKDIAQQE